MRRWLAALLVCMGGCAAPKPAPPTPPGPSEFKVKVDIMLDLPEASATQRGIPAKLKLPLQIEARSVAVAPEWKRSRYSGRLDVALTSLDGSKTCFSCKTDVDGETDGPPEHGLGQIFSGL